MRRHDTRVEAQTSILRIEANVTELLPRRGPERVQALVARRLPAPHTANHEDRADGARGQRHAQKNVEDVCKGRGGAGAPIDGLGEGDAARQLCGAQSTLHQVGLAYLRERDGIGRTGVRAEKQTGGRGAEKQPGVGGAGRERLQGGDGAKTVCSVRHSRPGNAAPRAQNELAGPAGRALMRAMGVLWGS